MYWLTPQIPTTAEAELGQRQELGTQSRTPMWMVGPHVFETLSTVTQDTQQQEAGPELE